jgi:hypothetical protein
VTLHMMVAHLLAEGVENQLQYQCVLLCLQDSLQPRRSKSEYQQCSLKCTDVPGCYSTPPIRVIVGKLIIVQMVDKFILFFGILLVCPILSHMNQLTPSLYTS